MKWGKKPPNPNILHTDFLKAFFIYLWPILLIGRAWLGQTHFWAAVIFDWGHSSNPAIPFQIHSSVGRLILLRIFWHNTLETPDRNRRQREEYDHWSLTSSIVCLECCKSRAMYWIWIFWGPAIVFFRESINLFVSLFLGSKCSSLRYRMA